MEIKPVSEVLVSAGLSEPTLNALLPNEHNYKVLLMQPHGQIEVGATGVRNRNRDLAIRQFGKFLDNAHETQADLVITPEYSMPWQTLVTAIKAGTVPAQGKLWVLGCESIKYSELEALKQELAPVAIVLYETLHPNPNQFTDPLAYVFVAPINGNGAARVIVLIQFKTYPMGDNDHFEINSLQLGTHIYKFGSNGQSLKLVSLICSDVFAFQDAHANAIYDRALVIHIQMTPKPRQEQFRQYRNRLLFYKGDETELVCLNWAKDVHEWCDDRAKPWHNIAGSAWYLKPSQFDERDETLCDNHRRGLYYTWLDPLRAHALFFNFEPATYLLEATKVAHIGVPAVISRRRGPQLTQTCVWNDAATAWVEQAAMDDGFSAVVDESGDAKDEIRRIANVNPLEAERVLALCAGKIGPNDDWHNVRKLDSCVINESEVIRRITFCQDTHEHACEFRIERLKRCGYLWQVLEHDDLLPAALVDFKQGFRLEWSPDSPHQNAISATGKRATVIYMGEGCSTKQLDAVHRRAAEFLHRGSPNPDKSIDARQRLAVWFRGNNSEIDLYDPDRFIKYDKSGHTSEFDIGRET